MPQVKETTSINTKCFYSDRVFTDDTPMDIVY